MHTQVQHGMRNGPIAFWCMQLCLFAYHRGFAMRKRVVKRPMLALAVLKGGLAVI